MDKFDTFGILPHHLPNAIGLWENEQECLAWLATQADPTKHWLEIGAFCGGSTIILALAKQQPTLMSIDLNFDPMFDFNVFERGKFDRIVQKIQCNSIDFGRYYDRPTSLAFIDGFHSFSHVVHEFMTIDKLLTDDGIVIFHDVSPDLLYHNQANLEEIAQYAHQNYDTLMDSQVEDFRLDEAVALICIDYGYEIIDIPVRKDIFHTVETHLDKWVRGSTSPFNALTAIRKKV